MPLAARIVAILCCTWLIHAGPAAALDVVDAHAKYPEGPLWDQGRLLYVEYAGAGIKLWDGTGTKIFWRKEHCGASGLIHFRENHILVACYDGNYLVELDTRGHELRTLTRDISGKPFIGPNDFTTDGHGGVYFSASGVYDVNAPISGTVLHLAPNGEEAGSCRYDTLFQWIDVIQGWPAFTGCRDVGRQNFILPAAVGRDFGSSSRVGAPSGSGGANSA